jgi:hypothetical protein
MWCIAFILLVVFAFDLSLSAAPRRPFRLAALKIIRVCFAGYSVLPSHHH